MEGVIQRVRKDGTIAYISRPWDPALKKHVWLDTWDDELDAAMCSRDYLAGKLEAPDRTTCAVLADEWLEEHTPTLKESTGPTYRQNIKKFKEKFGLREVGTLAHSELQLWANSVGRHNVDAAKYMFTYSLDAGKITSHPMAKVKVSRTVQRMVKPLTVEQVRALAQASLEIHPEPMASMWAGLILFMAGSGLRPNEINRLYAEHIDYENEIAYVAPSKNWKDGIVVLTPLALEGLSMIPRRLPGKLIFTNTKGNPLAKSGIHYWFDPIRCRAGFPDFQFKELRHTCGTLLAEAGVSAVGISMQLRHSDMGRTAEKHYIRPHETTLLAEIKGKLGSNGASARPQFGRIAVASGGDAA